MNSELVGKFKIDDRGKDISRYYNFISFSFVWGRGYSKEDWKEIVKADYERSLSIQMVRSNRPKS